MSLRALLGHLIRPAVQLTKKGLQVGIQEDPEFIHRWDELVPRVERMIRTKVLRRSGFSPEELMLGFNPRFDAADHTVTDIFTAQATEGKMLEVESNEAMVVQESFDERLAKLDEIRQLSTDARAAAQIMEARDESKQFKEGDLVLLWR